MARILKIKDEAVFQVEESNFAISPSTTGYTLNYSADGVNFTPWTDGTLAEVTQVVACAARGMYYKLVGNVGDVVITF